MSRERPIIFSGPLVRAILDDRKTETRRVIRPQPVLDAAAGRWSWRERHLSRGVQLSMPAHCPYGAAGDRLWVREAWGSKEADRPGVPGGRRPQPGDSIVYRADPGDAWQWRDGSLPWRPSIYMPRWASRVTLEVVEVRVERLQEITGEGAVAEGVAVSPCGCEACAQTSVRCPATASDAVLLFAELWDSISGKRPGCSWADSPWVWVVRFRRVEVNHA